MVIKIQGEKPFSIQSNAFGVSPSNEEYTLQYSVDGVNYTDYKDKVPAGENLVVCGVSKELFFRLKDNNSDVMIKY